MTDPAEQPIPTPHRRIAQRRGEVIAWRVNMADRLLSQEAEVARLQEKIAAMLEQVASIQDQLERIERRMRREK